jgi:hypothetical protein
LLCSLAPTVAAHADYSWELAGVYDHTQRDADHRRLSTSEFDTDQVSLSATRYFEPVADSSGPLALAAFFDPRTELSVVAGDGNTADRSWAGPNSLRVTTGEEDVGDYSLRGFYLFRDSKWYAGGRYARHEGERTFSSTALTGTGFGESSEEVEDYALFGGKYFGKGATRLELSLEQSTLETEVSSTSCTFTGVCFGGSPNTSEETWDIPRLSVMHVRQIRSATYALLGDVSEQRFQEGTYDGTTFTGGNGDPPRTYFVGAELYPVPTIGVRLGYEKLDSLGVDEDTVSMGASWFFKRNVGLELTLSRLATDINNPFSTDDPVDIDRAAIRVIGRL